MNAAEQLLCERGADHLTVDDICAAAGCSRSAFHAVFSDRCDLLLALFDELTSRLGEEMVASCRAESRWEDAMRAALTRLLWFLDAKPNLARFLIVDSLAGDARMLARRRLVRERLVRALDAIASPARARSQSGPFDAETIVGTIAAILHARLMEEPVPPLHELGGALMGVIVLSHMGVEAARAELSRPLPTHPSSLGDQ